MAKRVPQNSLRIGDEERNRAVELLQDHTAAGRLTSEEFDSRVTLALSAKTAADLRPLFADLPGPNPGEVVAPEDDLAATTHARVQQLQAEMRQRQQAEVVPVDRKWLRVLTVAVGASWPLALLVYFGVGFAYWWVFLVPVALSVLLGNARRGIRVGPEDKV